MKPKLLRTPKKLILVVIAAVITLMFGNLVVSNVLATSGERLRSLENRKQNLTSQNERLRLEINTLSSLRTLEARATNLGLTGTVKTVNVPLKPPIAMHQ